MLLRIKTLLSGIILLFIFAAPAQLQAAETGSPRIEINLPARTITLYDGTLAVKEYPVAIGKVSTPTPLGNFAIVSKEINPSWYPPERPGYVVPPGPNNPLGRRWLGFIADNYGIHGTNAPSSIGLAVTNGCIRMKNADVEELFELVGYNTPVKITYDLTKVYQDKSGRIEVSIHPDVYGRGKKTVASVRAILEKYGLGAFVDDDYLAQILAASGNSQAVVIKTVGLMINGVPLAGQGIVAGENRYIPIQSVSTALAAGFSGKAGLGGVLDKDERQQAEFLLVGEKRIPVFIVNNDAYMSGRDIEKLLGGRQSGQADDKFWSFEKITVFYNGKKTALETVKINETLAVPLKDLVAVLGKPGRWDADAQIFYLENTPGNSPVQINPDMIGPEPFLLITEINRHFNTFVYWDIKNNTIELTSELTSSEK